MEKDSKFLLGKRLKVLRRKYNVTQQELAEKSKLAYKYIQKLEGKNPSSPTLSSLVKIANAFKMTPSKLINFRNRGI